MVVELPATMSVSKVFHLLKGASARGLFKRKTIFYSRYPRKASLASREILSVSLFLVENFDVVRSRYVLQEENIYMIIDIFIS